MSVQCLHYFPHLWTHSLLLSAPHRKLEKGYPVVNNFRGGHLIKTGQRCYLCKCIKSTLIEVFVPLKGTKTSIFIWVKRVYSRMISSNLQNDKPFLWFICNLFPFSSSVKYYLAQLELNEGILCYKWFNTFHYMHSKLKFNKE